MHLIPYSPASPRPQAAAHHMQATAKKPLLQTAGSLAAETRPLKPKRAAAAPADAIYPSCSAAKNARCTFRSQHSNSTVPATGPYRGPRPMGAATYAEYAHGLQAQQHRQHGARAQQKRQQPVGHVFAVAHRPIRRVYPFHILRCMDQIREHVKCVGQKQQPQHSERRTSRPKGGTARQRRQNTAAAAPTAYSMPAPAPKDRLFAKRGPHRRPSTVPRRRPIEVRIFSAPCVSLPVPALAALYRKAIKRLCGPPGPHNPKAVSILSYACAPDKLERFSIRGRTRGRPL